MKITPENPRPKPPGKPPTRRKTARTPRKTGPPTPLLRWKFDDKRDFGKSKADNNDGEEEEKEKEKSPEIGRKKGKGVSARKLAAVLWRMQAEEGGGDGGGDEERRRRRSGKSGDGLGFKPEIGHGGDRLSYHHAGRECGSADKDPHRSPRSVNGPTNSYLCERQSPFQLSNYAMEGVTKWDPVRPLNDNAEDSKIGDQNRNAASNVSLLEAELEQARARVEELESERRSSKKKLEHFLKKLSEERSAWRAREHEKVRAIIDDVKSDLNRERKNRQRLEIVNSKLVNELAEAKLSAKRYIQDYEKERKARELIEEVCDELAKEIGEDKAEVDSLKKECMKIREEVEDERRMLQMAEVWREERVQMKLIDAKVALDQKHSQMSWLVMELEKFLRSNGANLDTTELRQAEMLRRAAASVKIEDIKELTYEPSNSDDIFAVVEEMAMAAECNNEREIEECVEECSSPTPSKDRRFSNVYVDRSGDVDDDASGWETVSHAEDQDSCYSHEGSVNSGLNNKIPRDSNVSGSCTEWEETTTPIADISSKGSKKAKTISRLWRSRLSNGDNYKTITVDGVSGGRISNGRVSNGTNLSSDDHGSGKGDWSSPDSMDPKGMKGCIEWPRGGLQKNSLKHRFMEGRMDTQKIQLRHVLKQKI